MATLGDVLSTPESGWKRIENNDVLIKYTGNFTTHNSSGFSGGSLVTCPNSSNPYDNYITFYVKCDSIRVIEQSGSNYNPSDDKIVIDNNEYIINSAQFGTESRNILVFEKTGLQNKIHKIELLSGTNANRYGISFDAIDINESGEMKSEEDYNNQEEVDFPNISHKNASLVYTLPMATTEKIKAKSNDKRVGLLGLANDDENFGDLYVVGKDGKSHLTKSGIKSEVLYDGLANATGEYGLTNSIDNYSYIVVYSGLTNKTVTSIIDIVSNVISKDYIKIGTANQFVYNDSIAISGVDYTRRMRYHFKTNKSINIDSITIGSNETSTNDLAITRVEGIY